MADLTARPEANADREERERTVHLAGMLLCAEAHVTRALDELEHALELRPGDLGVVSQYRTLTACAEQLGSRVERLRERVEAWTPGLGRDEEAGW